MNPFMNSKFLLTPKTEISAWNAIIDVFQPGLLNESDVELLVDFLLPSKYLNLGEPTLFGTRTVTVFVKNALAHRRAHHKILMLLLERRVIVHVAEASIEDENKAREARNRALN